MTDDAAKVALVTGGASGIGAAIAQNLLGRGWRVAIVDTNVEAMAELTVAGRDRVLPILLDVCVPDAARSACDTVIENWKRLDFLVNCAGTNRQAPFEIFSLEDWNLVLATNLTSTFRFMQEAARCMLAAGSGVIVNISSIAGARGNPDRCAYAATKAAIASLTQSGAVAWATRGIRVNAVAPGFTQTPLVQRFVDDGSVDVDTLLNITPMGRLATPEEVAAAVVFLGSDESSFITGQTLYVDGGFMAHYGLSPSERD